MGVATVGKFGSSGFLISFIVFSHALYVNSRLSILKSGKMTFCKTRTEGARLGTVAQTGALFFSPYMPHLSKY